MLARLRQLYVPILTQITVPYLLLAMAVVAGATFIVTQFISSSVADRFTNQLIETAGLTAQSMVRQNQDLLQTLRLLSNIEGVGEAVQTGDSAALEGLVLPAAFNAKLQGLIVLRANGSNFLAVTLNPDSQNYESLVVPGSVTNLTFVRNVLNGVQDAAGDKFAGLVATDGGDFLFISGPIRGGNG